jgi:hypothetical protein
MRLHLLRCVLDPITSLRALRRSVHSRGTTSFDVAWRQVRVERFPEEALYQQYGHLTPAAPDRHEPHPSTGHVAETAAIEIRPNRRRTEEE